MATALVVATASAQSQTALAEALFQEAKRLMDDRRFPEACPKLAESQRLDPGTGTLILLAACHEREGKVAASWSEYVEARAQATQAGRKDRIRAAEEGEKRVLLRLSKLTVAVRSDARVSGLVVRVDGSVLPEAGWGVATPIDPGEHVVEASAPGRAGFKATVSFAATAEARTVEIAPLDALAPQDPVPAPTASARPAVAPPPTPVEPTQPGSERPSRAPAYVVGGVGVASLLVGGFFGLRARSDVASANDVCPQRQCANEDALAKSESAGRSAKLANVFLGLGVVGVGVGAVLLIRTGSSSAAVRIGPTVGFGQASLSAAGAF